MLAGNDCMRKVGSKRAAMTCDPINYMTNFGETDTLLEQDTELAKKYLERVWAGARSTITCETFDQFRAEIYITSTVGINVLPDVRSEATFKENYSWCAELLATANEHEARLYNHYSMDGRIFRCAAST